jgi:hypothetical protein
MHRVLRDKATFALVRDINEMARAIVLTSCEEIIKYLQ